MIVDKDGWMVMKGDERSRKDRELLTSCLMLQDERLDPVDVSEQIRTQPDPAMKWFGAQLYMHST
jgi:hypothetical protein